MEWGYTGFTPMSVRPSVRPSVCRRFPELLEKTIGSIHSIPGIYPYGVSLSTLIHFRVPSLNSGPLVAKSLAENGVSGTFWKKILAQFISYLAFTLVGLLSPTHFRVHNLSFGPLVAKYLAENWVSRTFWKNYWLNSFHTWHLPLWGESLDPIHFLRS